MKICLLLCISLAISVADLSACTIVKLEQKPSVLIGHSFDWPQQDAHLIVNKRGVRKVAFAGQITGETPATWISRHGSLSLTWISQEVPTAGINEAGLLVAGLLLQETEYAADGSAPVISSSQWKQYLLDTSASVKEALERMRQVRITTTTRFGQHFFLADSSGDVAVVEFLEGVPQIYHRGNLPVPALTNTLYASASGQAVEEKKAGPVAVGPGLRGDSTSRFLLAAESARMFDPISETSRVNKAFDALNRVRRSNTQWQVVYDLNRKRVSWRTKLSPEIQTVTLLEQDLTCSVAAYRPLGAAPETAFEPLVDKPHRNLLRTANRQLNLRRAIYGALQTYPQSLECMTAQD